MIAASVLAIVHMSIYSPTTKPSVLGGLTLSPAVETPHGVDSFFAGRPRLPARWISTGVGPLRSTLRKMLKLSAQRFRKIQATNSEDVKICKAQSTKLERLEQPDADTMSGSPWCWSSTDPLSGPSYRVRIRVTRA